MLTVLLVLQPAIGAGSGKGSRRVPPVVTPDKWGVLTVIQESLGEPYEGKLAVAEVIRNRMRRKYASDGTVIGTVLRPSQFSGWNSRDPSLLMSAKADDDHMAVRDCIKAWIEAFEHETNTVSGSVLYHADYVKPPWASAPSVKLICKKGRHLFYTDRGGA